ncbi:MAG: hypothetical protein ETSY1_44520 [Candidatus Entotheonella factor]|uniref:Uncharacterized protein n=1 Tax=Entotheonella factor TaxID=1429438 RepID=W4L3J3_ENTF1|nr:MAG: hypothetical protein ETSY1_44520 [Candidatus Entotheonella factor]
MNEKYDALTLDCIQKIIRLNVVAKDKILNIDIFYPVFNGLTHFVTIVKTFSCTDHEHRVPSSFV